MMVLFTMVVIIRRIFTAAVSLQYAYAISDDKSTQCKDHRSDTPNVLQWLSSNVPFPMHDFKVVGTQAYTTS